jgi:hypothetical protein
MLEDIHRAEERGRLSGKWPMEMLLSPPGELDECDGSLDDALTHPVLSHSVSSDSVPSLYTDDDSSISLSPSTPSTMRRSTSGRIRATSPAAECCVEDHPLLDSAFDSDDDNSEMIAPEAPQAEVRNYSLSTFRRLSLKSNLTASLRVLKSAARSFSALQAPMVHPEDFLTRSIMSISPQFTDEKRPLPLEDAPTPALRRYLNPTTVTSPSEHFGRLSASEDRCTASIQMQTYRISRSRKQTSSRPLRGDKKSQPELPLTGPPARQRENRENSDFLRVIVLEMNMRREGKLSDTAQGKARFALPPRQASKIAVPSNATSTGDDGSVGGVPSRWIALLVEE